MNPERRLRKRRRRRQQRERFARQLWSSGVFGEPPILAYRPPFTLRVTGGGDQALVKVSVPTSQGIVKFFDPTKDFPSNHLIAQLMLVAQ